MKLRIYIDGENLRHGITGVLKSAGLIEDSAELKFFPIRTLLKDALGVDELEIRYYSSKIKLPHGYEPSQEIKDRAEEIKQFSRAWVADLAKQDIQYIKAGYLKLKTGAACPNCGHKHEVLQEKGVDVRIAVDIVADGLAHQHETIVIVSSDSDLIPSLQHVKQRGVPITYVCFADRVNRAISTTADETITIPSIKVKKLFQEKSI